MHEVTLNPLINALIFSCLSIASVDGKQHLSDVVFSALVGFSLSGKLWVHGLIHTPRTHRACSTPQTVTHEHHNHRWQVLGVRIRSGTSHFPYNENPTRALNTTSLKFLPSTEAIDRWGKIYTCLMQVCFIKIHQVFIKKGWVLFIQSSTHISQQH